MKSNYNNFLVLIFIFTFFHVKADNYEYNVDLINIINDKVKVTCIVPKQETDKSEFIFPNLIPGSYALKEYGRYVVDFKAFDVNGIELKTKKADKFNYSILNAKRLYKVEYYINDSWEEKNGKRFIFQPGGTNIDKGKNFVINNYGYFGYFEGMKNINYKITFRKPAQLKGYSYLNLEHHDTVEFVNADNYDQLVDNPIMFCPPNEASFISGGATIEICVYSENQKVKAEQIADILKPLSHALEKFFGQLPVNKYMFLLYFADPDKTAKVRGKGLGSGFGALEHNHCSFYYIPEVDEVELLKKELQEVCAHEFLHILTPLNLHSKEIDDFNFRIPNMSKHLWLYEGVTEYFSILAQLQDTIIKEKEFLKEVRKKIRDSEKYGKFSMTNMSKNVIDNTNQKRYTSVYSRGALIGMMLDLLIIDRSKGKNSLKQVITTLGKKYGPLKPFDDDSLFTEIVNLTHPDVKYFIDQYIEGNDELDFTDLSMIGYSYDKVFQYEIYYFGSFGLKYNDNSGFVFVEVEQNKLSIEENDILISINDLKVDLNNFSDLYEESFSNNENANEMKIIVKRNGQETTLTAKPEKAIRTGIYSIRANPNATSRELENKKVFFGITE